MRASACLQLLCACEQRRQPTWAPPVWAGLWAEARPWKPERVTGPTARPFPRMCDIGDEMRDAGPALAALDEGPECQAKARDLHVHQGA
eukprot:15452602-Alexandrium_andersonii.AAC.1